MSELLEHLSYWIKISGGANEGNYEWKITLSALYDNFTARANLDQLGLFDVLITP